MRKRALFLFVFVWISVCSVKAQYIKVSKEFYKYPIDSLLLYSYPQISLPMYINTYGMEFKWSGGMEFREKSGSRDWPGDIQTLINKNSQKSNFEIIIEAISVTGKGQEKRDYGAFKLQIVPDFEYPPTTPIVKKIKSKQKDIKAKLLYSLDDKLDPLKSTTVDLYYHGHKTLSTVTDEMGNFSFKGIEEKTSYDIVIPKEGLDPEKHKTIILAQTSGKPIKNLVCSASGDFVFELLASDAITLDLLEDKDHSAIPIDQLLHSSKDKIDIVRNINFDENSSEIHPEDFSTLNKMVAFMKANPLYNLEIIGHSDSKGDAHLNQKLSAKRAHVVLLYFQRKAINIKRLKSQGKGESELINHCADGVECTEAEHAANRRVEFKFTKIK